MTTSSNGTVISERYASIFAVPWTRASMSRVKAPVRKRMASTDVMVTGTGTSVVE